MIDRVALSLMLSLGTLACSRDGGLKPTAPTTTGFAVTLELSPDPRAVGGFTNHTSVAVALHDGAGLGGTLEEASFIVRDSERTVVAESGVTEVVAIPRGGVLRLQRDLIIPAGASPGRSLEWRLLIRDGRGELHVVAQTLDVQPHDDWMKLTTPAPGTAARALELIQVGIRLLPELAEQAKLKLTKHRVYTKTGTVALEYDVA